MTPEAAIHLALMKRINAMSVYSANIEWNDEGTWDDSVPTWNPSGSLFIPIYFREIPADRPQTDYIEVDHLPNANDRLFVTSGRLWRQGILQLTLCSKLGQFQSVFVERAGLMAQWFAPNLALTEDGVTIEIVKTDVGRGLAEGGHWRIPVSVYYRGFA